MLISEVIANLEQQKKEQGDVPVYLLSRYDQHEIKWIDYYDEDKDRNIKKGVYIKQAKGRIDRLVDERDASSSKKDV